MHAFLNTFISYTIGACQPPSSAPKQLASSGKLSTDYFDVDEHPKSRNSPTRQMPRMSLPQTPARKSAQQKKDAQKRFPSSEIAGIAIYLHIAERIAGFVWSCGPPPAGGETATLPQRFQLGFRVALLLLLLLVLLRFGGILIVVLVLALLLLL